MKRICITRDGSDVNFETVSVDTTETVFFINLDPLDEHWPDISSNKLGPAPSPPSGQCHPEPSYGCLIPGHESERGFINIFAPLAEASTMLDPATLGQPITEQRVVQGGMSPYKISDQLFEVTDSNGTVIQSGSGIGPGLHLTPDMNNMGIWVSGTPTLSGVYNFTFTVDDAMGGNLQQVQYRMVVA